MKTVSTKLDNSDFETFQNMCNHEGLCASEELREIVKMCLVAYEEGLEIERDENKVG